MLTSTAFVTIVDVLVLAAAMTWFVHRHARARSANRRRAAIIAQLRQQVDRDSPIVGWMVLDNPVSRKPARRVRELH